MTWQVFLFEHRILGNSFGQHDWRLTSDISGNGAQGKGCLLKDHLIEELILQLTSAALLSEHSDSNFWLESEGQGSSSHKRMIWPWVYITCGTRKEDEACNYLKISFMSWCKIIFYFMALFHNKMLPHFVGRKTDFHSDLSGRKNADISTDSLSTDNRATSPRNCSICSNFYRSACFTTCSSGVYSVSSNIHAHTFLTSQSDHGGTYICLPPPLLVKGLSSTVLNYYQKNPLQNDIQ